MQYDLKLFGGELIQDNIFDVAIQELDILFGTEETELLGDYKFGVNFEQFLWKLQPSKEEVNIYTRKKIIEYTYFCKELNVKIDTDIMMGTLRDIYVIHIELTDNSGKTVKSKNYIMR